MKDFNELLCKTIDKVSNNRNLYGKSEPAVRDQLINPILTFLGWDTTDPSLVIPNARTEDNNIPDYTLIKNAVTQAYVEAKKITPNLKDNIHQLARYCTDKGIEYGVLTNGIEWMLFKSFEKGKSMNERILWTINLEKDTAAIVFRHLNIISYNNIENIAELTKKDATINDKWNKIAATPLLLKNAIVEIIENELKKDKLHFESSEIEEFVHNKLELTSNIENVITSSENIDTTVVISKIKIENSNNRSSNNSNEILILAKLESYPSVIVKYFNLIDSYIKSLGIIATNVRKYCVSYYDKSVKKGKAVVWIEPQKNKIKITLSNLKYPEKYPDTIKRIVDGPNYPEIIFESDELEKHFDYIKKLLTLSFQNICDK